MISTIYHCDQERQRVQLEEKCTELLNKLNSLDQELQQFRPLQSTHANLQRQYVELQECIQKATKEARRYYSLNIIYLYVKVTHHNMLCCITIKSLFVFVCVICKYIFFSLNVTYIKQSKCITKF